MKIFLLICIIILSLNIACEDKEDNFPGTYPCCLQPAISNILNNPPLTPRTHLSKYYYQGQYAYSFDGSDIPPNYADYLSSVINDHCEAICWFGGIAGFKCDGWDSAEFIEVVWDDTR